ncbi:MAG: hypothetical protein AAFY41_05780 [Bacteroidota bacterium]
MRSILSTITLCLVILASAFSQDRRSAEWKKNNDRKNRYEGTYTRKVSNPSIDLVSLKAYQEEYESSKGHVLKVQFYTPEAMEYRLIAQELRVTRFYWMEAKDTLSIISWNTFQPWPVDYLLRRLRITYQNLGVVAQLLKEGSRKREFAPVYVYHSSSPGRTSYYVAYFHLGRPASGGSYSISSGRHRANAELLQTYPISKKSGGTAFPIRIKTELLESSGWYTVEVNLREKGTLDPFSYSFSFYHKE